jgi:ComF family protein
LIHALKYRGGLSIASAVAPKIAQAWQTYSMSSALLVPVPLHPKRELRRGYNQAYLLAKALSHQVDVPVAPRLLERVRNTASQTKLGFAERQRNVAGAFHVAPGLDLTDYTVTLIDDVATTGSTLHACAQALLAANARSVNAFTLARAA